MNNVRPGSLGSVDIDVSNLSGGWTDIDVNATDDSTPDTVEQIAVGATQGQLLLAAGGSNNRYIWFRFQNPGFFSGGELRYSLSPGPVASTSGIVRCYAMFTDWNISTLTWNNKPALSSEYVENSFALTDDQPALDDFPTPFAINQRVVGFVLLFTSTPDRASFNYRAELFRPFWVR